MIGDAQPEYQTSERIAQAGRATGYAFRITRFESAEGRSVVEVQNVGVAPIYYDAYPTVNGTRSTESLKGLLPDQKKRFRVSSGGTQPKLTIECDRLTEGQAIEYEAKL